MEGLGVWLPAGSTQGVRQEHMVDVCVEPQRSGLGLLDDEPAVGDYPEPVSFAECRQDVVIGIECY